MTESRQSKRGWFEAWREQRRAGHRERLEHQEHLERLERTNFESERAGRPGGMFRRSSAYQHGGSAPFFGGYGGGDGGGGGCGGDGGGGGGC